MNTKNEMSKSLKDRHVTMIALGGVIGAGLFVGSGAVIHAAGPGAILSYFIAGVIVILVMRMLGELATLNPSSGSFSEYARDAVGPWLGFTVGWLYWFFWVIVIAIEATAGAAIIQYWLPQLPLWLSSLALLGIFTIANSISVKSFGEVEYWFASIKIICIVLFLIIGIAFIIGFNPNGNSIGFSNLIAYGGFLPKGLSSIAAGIVVVLFSFFGCEIVTIAAAESKNPEQSISKAIRSVIWRVLIFYVGSITVIVALLPWNSGSVLKSPFVAVMDESLQIPYAPQIMNGIVLVSVLSCLNAGLYTTSRMLYSLSKQGDAPSILSNVGSKGTPLKAILFTSLIAAVGVFLNFFAPDSVFLFLINSSGAIGLLVYLCIAVSQLITRKKIEKTNLKQLKVKMWFFPYLTYFTILIILVIFVSMGVMPSMRAQLGLTILLTSLIVLFYFIFKEKKQTRVNDSSKKRNEKIM